MSKSRQSRNHDKRARRLRVINSTIRFKKRLLSYLECHPCSDCGFSDIGYLEFHHIDPSTKLYTVAGMAGKPWATVMKEIAKCVVLCVKCHKKVHKTGLRFGIERLEEERAELHREGQANWLRSVELSRKPKKPKGKVGRPRIHPVKIPNHPPGKRYWETQEWADMIERGDVIPKEWQTPGWVEFRDRKRRESGAIWRSENQGRIRGYYVARKERSRVDSEEKKRQG